ncbi:MAG: methylated-DNA--[protein]-cysteine S-methyltransferase, partial [Desulforhabdus sp.]|nr:methylated-DNA--[protein]-cysteine S-methyltransferase [Desulforhabdus sp.]
TVDWRWEADHPVLKTVRHFLACYFSGKAATPDIRLAPAGSPFRQTVWNILSTIPIGQVVTYGQIAKQIADARRVPSMSAQAVGSAVAHNPISILIPCHRVVGFNGGLTGYAGGLERKAELLRIEKEISICSGNGVQR